MGPRLGRVEYNATVASVDQRILASMGPRLGRVEYGPLTWIKELRL